MSQRAELRDLVRRGYDAISGVYRSDAGESNTETAETTTTYGAWLAELERLVPAGSRVLDLGCGAGVPAARDLVAAGYRVTGVDISAVQVQRARSLVPQATFVQADMATWDAAGGSFEAIVCLYALIHLPLEDQRALIPRLRQWLTEAGHLLAIVGAQRWTGVEQYMGAEMFWDHEGTAAYVEWFADAGLQTQWTRFIPEGAGGHTLILARAV